MKNKARGILVEKFDKYRSIVNFAVMILGMLAFITNDANTMIKGILLLTIYNMASKAMETEVEEEQE